jgi:phosphoribosylformylglycinamidine (FGAM) synthase PurS component
LDIEADDKNAAEAMVIEACENLLINPVMEGFEITVTEA